MVNEDKILNYVVTYYPMDYEIVGKASTTRIINSILTNKKIELSTSEHGSNFDIVSSIELLALVVTVIKEIFEIIEHISKKKEKVTPERIEAEILRGSNNPKKSELIDSEEFKKLLQEIVDQNDV